MPWKHAPALAVNVPGGVRVLLGEGFAAPGVHQFSDGSTLADVINLTGWSAADWRPDPAVAVAAELIDGMALAVTENPGEAREIRVSWMPARQRLALGILLHPDRMSRDDWITLPGIGAKLAGQIDLDRQSIGDFGDFAALERVKGIGPAKLRALRPYFVSEDNHPK